MENSKIIYSINVEDVQNVADEVLERKLSDEEIKLIENKMGDFIDWYQAIEDSIFFQIKDKENE